MSTSTSREHYHNQHLPPSPPPSPSSIRRRQKKRHDSFEKLANTLLPSPPGSPSQESVTDEDKDSLLARIIITPVLFISFILSLSFVNIRDRANRTAAHSSTSLFKYLYLSSWLDPEPYQDPDDSRWGRRGTETHVEPHDSIGPNQGGQTEREKKKKKRSWHLNKKIRKMARLEVKDAFGMQGQVIVGMIAIMVVGTMVLWMSVKSLLASLTNFLS